MNNKTRKLSAPILIISVSALLIVLTCSALLLRDLSGNKTLPVSATPVKEESPAISSDIAENFQFSEQELRKTIEQLAKDRFGKDAVIIFLSQDGPAKVEIEGIERYVYKYAADSLSSYEQSGNARGLYHADPVSGEIFDNGTGKMEKIIIGE